MKINVWGENDKNDKQGNKEKESQKNGKKSKKILEEKRFIWKKVLIKIFI